MAFTLDDSRTYQRYYDKLNGSTRQQAIYDKNTNDSLREVYAMATSDFTQKSTRVSVAVPYSTGTVSVGLAGLAVTGVGTTFTNSMLGRFIRFNGEAEQYLITAFTDATHITIEAYLGTAALSAVNYVISEDRKTLPTLCRSIHKIVLTNAAGARGQIYYLEPRSFEAMQHMRQNYVTAVYPYYYCTKWADPVSGNVPVGYVYIYPSPSVAQIATIYYNTWPVALVTGTDQCPVPYEFEGVLREFLLAYVLRENKDQSWVTQLQKAQKVCMDAIAAARTNSASRIRQEWQPPYPVDYYREPVISPTVLGSIDP